MTLAVLSGCQQETPRTAPVEAAAPPTATPTQSAEAGDPSTAPMTATSPIAEAASESGLPPPPPSNSRPSFLIRFEAPHPIARAHGLAERQRMSAARSAVLAGLRQRHELDGLCFDSFTVGGAEIVLRACSDVADPAAFERRWVRRLQRMQGIDYAEANSRAQAESPR
jgi:hypothetical protein